MRASRLNLDLMAVASMVVVVASGCVDIGADMAKYVERQEKHFTVSGKPVVSLATFDGAIEIRTWDRRSEVQVTIEKRAVSKESAATIDVESHQDGDRIAIDVKVPHKEGFNIHLGDHRSAKLIVSVPAVSDVGAKTGDGSIDIEGVEGRVELGSGDGAIQGRRLGGDVKAHSGDGSIRLDDVKGSLDADTGDGGLVASGTFSGVRARSGDGNVTITAQAGSTSSTEWNITTGDGKVTLALPEGFAGELDAHTGDGAIEMRDMQLSNVTGEIRKNTVRGRLGNGGNTVRVRTGDGSITLKRS